jgi:hypothetical protein
MKEKGTKRKEWCTLCQGSVIGVALVKYLLESANKKYQETDLSLNNGS